MRWLFAVLAICALVLAPASVRAGDYHSGASLICSDCHVAHGSQAHVYQAGDPFFHGVAGGAPYKFLLRDEENNLCLSCHDGKTWAPDVFGNNTPLGGPNRLAGALNSNAAVKANDAGYDEIDGHTLWSTATAPGGTWVSPSSSGLRCIDCHSQHGQTVTQYRNLKGPALTYAITTNDPTKDVFERAPASYTEADVDYNEPNAAASGYATWCKQCHTKFHDASGSANMGGASGGDAGTLTPWLRHPQADVNIGQNATYISSLAQYQGHTNRVKTMDPNGSWAAPVAGVTPTCFSCHKSHGNKNGFGLIYMAGSGTTVTEEGDGGQYKDLCRQCHVQGG